MGKQRTYIAIDLKSFYASVECVERGLDPLDTCLVVADSSRTDKTICLAVSPALKAFGTGGRPRLFEVVERVGKANGLRGRNGKSYSASFLATHPDVAVDYIVATPRMALYIDYSIRAYRVYMRHVAPEDIHVYSIDEVFIDATDYVALYGLSPHRFAIKLIREVLAETGVTATAGIGSNLYLCKIAMDIVAKKMAPDSDGVRIAELDETRFRRELWGHLPLTDFWRVGRGIAARLGQMGLHTMGDLARFSLTHEAELYDIFGVNAELLIDHAWGREPVTLDYIKEYEPETHSVSSGQVLSRPYSFHEARNVLHEMVYEASLKLLAHRLVSVQVVVAVGYDVESIARIRRSGGRYCGRIKADYYGRPVPQHALGTANAPFQTSSSEILSRLALEVFDKVVDPRLLIRRLTVSFNNLTKELDRENPFSGMAPRQLSLFEDQELKERQLAREKERLARERKRQETVLQIKRRFGKNSILCGINYAEGATQRERNTQIGGHKA